MDTNFKRLVADTKKLAVDRLKTFGIQDKFVVKVKDVRADWLGQYRSNTQYTSRPIFWISERLPDIAAAGGVEAEDVPLVVLDTILHEFGHVIWEWAERRGFPEEQAVWDLIQTIEPDPEEFAETFAMVVRKGLECEPYRHVAALFGKAVND